MTIPPSFLDLWRAMDAMFARVEPTPWGAVITDGRYPRIWDANYARVEAGGLRLAEITAVLTPALEAAGVDIFHVVMFDHEGSARLLTDLSTLGHRLGWDLLMVAAGTTDPGAHAVEELAPGPELWGAVETSLSSFGADPADALAELRSIETEVMAPGGKRWFGIRDERGVVVSIAALLVLAGTGYVDNVATVPRCRGRGMASAVTAHVLERASAADVRQTYLLADPDETGVVAMYRRLGFEPTGRIASTRGPIPQSTNL